MHADSLHCSCEKKLAKCLTYVIYSERFEITERGKQIVRMLTNIILLESQKVFDITQFHIIDVLIEGQGVYKVTTTSIRWLPLSVI